MAVLIFGLFVAVLQISGSLSTDYYNGYGFRGLQRHRRIWNMRTAPNFETINLDQLHLYHDSENNVNDYSFILSQLPQNKEDTAKKSLSESLLDKSLSSLSVIAPSSAKPELLGSERTQRINSRNYQFFNLPPTSRHVIVYANTSNLSKVKTETVETQNHIPLSSRSEANPLANENVKSTQAAFTANTVRVKMFVENETNENTSIAGALENTVSEGEASESTTIEKRKKITTANLKIDEIVVGENETYEVSPAEKQTLEITTARIKIDEITSDHEKTGENTVDLQSKDDLTPTEVMLSTSSPNTSTFEIFENSTGSEEETIDITGFSVSDQTTLSVSNGISEDASVSYSYTDSSEGMQSTNAYDISTTGTTSRTESSDETSASTERDIQTSPKSEWESSSRQFVTKASHREVVINIPSIKTARIVVSAVFLAIGIVAMAVLAVCMFRVKRRTVQYDQLTLLP